jgi:hypothetical protein
MGKNKEFDFIEDAHEQANNNINPLYGFNRVTSFTVAGWKADRYFSPFFFILLTIMEVMVLLAYNADAISQNRSFWSYLFDFTNPLAMARLAGLLLLSFGWVTTGISMVQSIILMIYTKRSPSQSEHKKEKKKKYPKRPKNWK